MTSNIKSNRILSLDVFRGLTIVLMILVNSQGNDLAYPILEHASWNGCTLADLVFPFFLFIVGLTSVVGLKKYRSEENKTEIYKAILSRSILLFALGLFLNAFPTHLSLATFRVYGILQRIAFCYLICSVIYLNTSTRAQILLFGSILLGYWVVMTQLPVPVFGANQLTPEGSWVAYFDQLIFSAPHLLAKVYDPEGFFTTIPSIATTLAGVLTGTLLLTSLSPWRKFNGLIILGLVFVGTGYLWSYSFPLNKNLWTSSFVLWTGGWALLVFAVCFVLSDIWGFKTWTLPLQIFGMNALFAFCFHVILLKLQFVFFFPSPGGGLYNLKAAITDYLFGFLAPANAALMYSFCFLLLNFVAVSILYKKKIFIRL